VDTGTEREREERNYGDDIQLDVHSQQSHELRKVS
jgi:hypothetical protein